MQQAILSGAVNGSLYGIIGVGICLSFSARPILNFVQGDYLMLGAIVALVAFAHGDWPVWLGVLAVVALPAVLAVATNFLLLEPILRRGDTSAAMLALLGLSSVVTGIVALTVTDVRERVPPIITGSPIQIGDASLFRQNVALLVTAAVVAVGAKLLLARTSFGLRLRALSDAPDAASLVGIDRRWMFLVTFTVGGLLCGLGGMLGSQITGAYALLGSGLLVKGFGAAAIGGLTNPPAAILAGWALGTLEGVLLLHVASGVAEGAVVAALFLVLALRPQGLGGAGQRAVRAA